MVPPIGSGFKLDSRGGGNDEPAYFYPIYILSEPVVFSDSLHWQGAYYENVIHGTHQLEELFEIVKKLDVFDIVDDSNYISGANPGIGHPHENYRELFASAYAAYTVHPEKFLAYILDPDTSPAMQAAGKMLYLFMRDIICPPELKPIDDPLAKLSYMAVYVETVVNLDTLSKETRSGETILILDSESPFN